MEKQELKKLKRDELLEIMLAQSEEIDRLRARVEELEAELNDRELKFEKVGSIAEASLAVTRIFEEAERAATLYLENVKRIAGEKLKGRADSGAMEPAVEEKVDSGAPELADGEKADGSSTEPADGEKTAGGVMKPAAGERTDSGSVELTDAGAADKEKTEDALKVSE